MQSEKKRVTRIKHAKEALTMSTGISVARKEKKIKEIKENLDAK